MIEYQIHRILYTAAALTISMFLLSGCASKAPSDETTASEPAASESIASEPIASESSKSPSMAASGGLPSADLMLPVAEGLIRSYEEQGISYDDQDNQYVWWTLYHIVESVHRDNLPSQVTVSQDQLKYYMAAAFSERSELPPIPEGFSGQVSVNQDQQEYQFQLGQAPAGAVKISKAESVFGDLYEFTIHFSYADGSTSDYTLNAVDYPKGTDGNTPLFPYAFISMQPTEYPCTDNC